MRPASLRPERICVCRHADLVASCGCAGVIVDAWTVREVAWQCARDAVLHSLRATTRCIMHSCIDILMRFTCGGDM